MAALQRLRRRRNRHEGPGRLHRQRRLLLPLTAVGATQNTSVPSQTPKTRTTRKTARARKNRTFAMLRVVEATPVKPKMPATTEMRKKMSAHLSIAGDR